MDIIVNITSPPDITAKIEGPSDIICNVGDILAYPKYTGSMEITPGEDVQILNTSQKSISGDITIKSIPKDGYARITYNQNQTIRIW